MIFLGKLNKNLSIGLFIIALTVLLKQFTALPDFVLGLGYGTGIGFELVGILDTRKSFIKFRSHKMNLLNRLSK